MPRREFLALAKTFNPEKHDISGHYMSEKLDGVRAFWDGGITRGRETVNVPWAGLRNPKTGQLKDKIKPIATGLWSRYGNPIMAPDWFLNSLPCMPLDGELFAGRGNFQRAVSIVRKDEPVDEEWKEITFPVISSPDFYNVMQDGEVKNPQMWRNIKQAEVISYLKMFPPSSDWIHLTCEGGLSFSAELANLNEFLNSSVDLVYLHPQIKLPENLSEAQMITQTKLKEVLEAGGEGLILRHPLSIWTPKRSENILKVKQILDDEATVVGFTSGRKTNRGSKLLGMIGALILDYKGKRLELAGLNNDERQFNDPVMAAYAEAHPGVDMPEYFQGKHFKLGDQVTFLYRELSDTGIPKDARYYRKRTDQNV